MYGWLAACYTSIIIEKNHTWKDSLPRNIFKIDFRLNIRVRLSSIKSPSLYHPLDELARSGGYSAMNCLTVIGMPLYDPENLHLVLPPRQICRIREFIL